jgi:tRNA(adenine34) deaminase
MQYTEPMRLALAEAAQALQLGLLPVGCVIIDAAGQVIARAHKTSTGRLDHAETNAMRRLFGVQHNYRRGEGLTLLTTLEPCFMCFGMLSHCPVDTLVYATSDPYGGAAHIPTSSLPIRHRRQQLRVHRGVLQAEADDLFRQFLATTTEEFWRSGQAAELFRSNLA